MRQFMDYVQGAFSDATGWNREGSYTSLASTAQSIINFDTPRGLRLHLSSLASPNFATSYELGSIGVVEGSISYLYSSIPLRAHLTPQSDRLPLATLLQSYKPLRDLRRPGLNDNAPYPVLGPKAASLLYGRLYLPRSLLEALVIKRVSPALQLQLRAVSAEDLRGGGTVLGIAQYDVGRYTLDGLASSDGGLLGFRGLYNFGGDAAVPPHAATDEYIRDRIYGRFSAGGEIYYGTMNKSGGMSLGARFATLPAHKGTPLTATMTLNPLMGNVSTTYAVMAGRNCSLATKFDFNFYSYESEWAVGMELWRKKRPDTVDSALSAEKFVRAPERSHAAKLEWRLDEPVLKPVPVSAPPVAWPRERSFQAKLDWREDTPEEAAAALARATAGDDYSGVIKARLDQNLRIGVQWEGRAKSMIFSLGSGIDLRNMETPFRTLGVEVQFSS